MELTPKQQKALAIFNSTVNTAQAIITAVNTISRYKLPRIAMAARRRRAIAHARLSMTAYMGAAQVQMIASQPIPKYPLATAGVPGGYAVVGDTEPPPEIKRVMVIPAIQSKRDLISRLIAPEVKDIVSVKLANGKYVDIKRLPLRVFKPFNDDQSI